MSSIPGLPTQGSDVTVFITKVHLHHLCKFVEFWGKFSQERTADYEGLAKDIQSPGCIFREFEGNPCDQCLVKVNGTWYRSRIVSRNGSKYSVYLFDKGITFTTTSDKLAWGMKEHFHLPPEVEFCVLANVLPLSPENKWSPVALEFLKSLCGKSVKAHVQDVLVTHRMFVLHIPCISSMMYEMGFARKLFPDIFRDIMLLSLELCSGAEVSPDTLSQIISTGTVEEPPKQNVFMYPELPAETVETVIVTEVTNPQRIFCQLKVFSHELIKLSERLKQYCEGRKKSYIVDPEMAGSPCAARGNDGRWYRSIVQEVFPASRTVEVLNIDYGTKPMIQMENVRPLAAEFFRMPVVTYACSLQGVTDSGVGWTSSQIEFLRNLLLCKTVTAKFEYQSKSDGVNYVTLFGDDNVNINTLFGSKDSSLVKTNLDKYAMHSLAYSHHQEQSQPNMLNPRNIMKEVPEMLKTLPAEELDQNSSHLAVVQCVSSPSEFWIQMQNYANELDELMDSISDFYKEPGKDVVRNPSLGLYCAARAENGDFYRTVVSEVGERQIKVFFVDYGHTESVDRINIRNLPDKFKKLPRLALKCSLAGVKPKDERWSQSASVFFIKAVTGKILNVHVTAKLENCYLVNLRDPEAQGEKDLGTLMLNSSFAQRNETQRHAKATISMQPAILPLAQPPGAKQFGASGNSGMSFQTQNTGGFTNNETIYPKFKEHMFPIGSVLDVNVSYIESPNDFWCQLVQNARHLKSLMHDIQSRYSGSEFQPILEPACVARHPDNGLWYRALVIHKHETPHVDVLFVDYGQTETVSLYHLRRIFPEFLTLQGQAFRCSLLNPINPTSAVNDWNAEAIERFNSFVKTAACNFVILKCTIYAVMYSDQKILFNIVDLETPFESICTSMVNLVKTTSSLNASKPSFCLDTYYYSTHNIKTGTEEQVSVTCVNNVSQFYCQLERNTDVLKDLNIKVLKLCSQLRNVKLPPVFGSLCFAKYTDGQWYRGQIKATNPAVLVHFVDYGDTIEVDKSDLLPVPREANDIMSVPVQAIVCSLSDVPASVPREVNTWFETSATDCKFRALVVAREPNGKLLVELYHGQTQINSKLKTLFHIEMDREEVVCHDWKVQESAKYAEVLKAAPKKDNEMEYHAKTVKSISTPQPANQVRGDPKPVDAGLESASKTSCQKVKFASLELYRPPHQRQSHERLQSKKGKCSEPAGAQVERKTILSTNTEQLNSSSAPGTGKQREMVEKLPKVEDLPLNPVVLGMEADVYISHCNSPMSFYVQLVREEEEIFSIVDKLNDPKSSVKMNDVKDLNPGDLVQAEFGEDSSWYRAVVREIHADAMALVEFVDFGNTAMTPISKIAPLDRSFLQFPVYSTHCMLSSAADCHKEDVCAPEAVSAFKEFVESNGEKVLKCLFVRRSGPLWEVSLADNGVNITCDVTTRKNGSKFFSDSIEQGEENPSQTVDTTHAPEKLYSQRLDFLEGQQLEIYVIIINDAHTIWCQCADTEALDKITLSVSEVVAVADQTSFNPRSLPPGSPCIALYSDDALWYRAKVIDTDGDDLCVFFVDYGNMAQVNIADVREMPPDLLKIPPQAFVCSLEGFDSSLGSWDSRAVDELSAVTADKLLQVTFTKVERNEENLKCCGLMECDGQSINERMKMWWKSLMADAIPGEVEPTTSCEPPLKCESAVKEGVLINDHLEHPEVQDDNKEQFSEHAEPPTTNDICTGPDDFPPPLNDKLKEDTDASVLKTTDLVEIGAINLRDSFDDVPFSDPCPAHNPDDGGTVIRKSERAVKMVPRENVCPVKSPDLHKREEPKIRREDLNEIDTALVLPPLVLPVPHIHDAPTDQDTEGEMDVPQKVPCVTTHVKVELTTEETLASHEDPGDDEPENYTLSATDMVEEVTCAFEEARFTEPTEPSDDSEVGSAGAECPAGMTIEETVLSETLELSSQHVEELAELFLQENVMSVKGNSMTEEEASALAEEHFALSSDTEQETYTNDCSDMCNLAEQVASLLVGETPVADCKDPQEDAETDDGEPATLTPAQQKEDLDTSVLPEEVFPFESHEIQLSKISDGSADVLQQPEE